MPRPASNLPSSYLSLQSHWESLELQACDTVLSYALTELQAEDQVLCKEVTVLKIANGKYILPREEKNFCIYKNFAGEKQFMIMRISTLLQHFKIIVSTKYFFETFSEHIKFFKDDAIQL